MKQTTVLPVLLCGVLSNYVAANNSSEYPSAGNNRTVEEVKVWGDQGEQSLAEKVGPVSRLRQSDFVSINMATTEDSVKYEPSVVIRRRFIGDANGTLGIRSANMFQTSRSMVFADGVPLHYFLQSRWNGAPRWTMVSASEIAKVDVVYGPFSAEYSGNAMGGVVLIETAIPQQREIHLDGSFYRQDFAAYGFDDRVDGYKGFVSYGDTLGEVSVYLSYNHLHNESQPQSFYYAAGTNSDNATPASGGLYGPDAQNTRRLYFGDTGVIDTRTDNVKFKLGYEKSLFSALFNLAYEDRTADTDRANSYIKDDTGQTIWGGLFTQDGRAYSLPATRLNVSAADRESLSLGLRLRAHLSATSSVEANLSQFSILDDENRSSQMNPQHPAYSLSGQVTDYEDTGWNTFDLKLRLTDVMMDGLDWVNGARYEAYELNYRVFSSANYVAGSKDQFTSASGGQTAIAALFSQLNWQLTDALDLGLGVRYEDWQSRDGYYTEDDAATPRLDRVDVPGNSKSAVSPKFSLGYRLAETWLARYSVGRAYRFAIVEELFSQYEAYNAVSESNPTLQPEKGLHQNVLLQKELEDGYVRLNVYEDRIDDVIESQSTVLPGGASVRTFIPVDEVRTRGVELALNANDFLLRDLDIRLNLAYTEAEIMANTADPTLVGNRFPRMPDWRGNLLATYHLTDRWFVGSSVQYASNSYGRLDNTDTAEQVYGAQDGYTRIGLKTGVNLSRHLNVSLGVDNLTNAIAYVAHPWPGRTLYLNFAYQL